MRHSIGFVYSALNSDVHAQIVRDLLVLSGEWDIEVYDPKNEFSELLGQLQIPKTEEKPELYIIYRTEKEWPESPGDGIKVQRDLKPSGKDIMLNGEPRVGYFLKPQGWDGPNLTERYLNRPYPKGMGVVDPFMIAIWG